MRRRSGLLIAGLTIAATVLARAPAFARPIEKGHFHDVFTSDVYDCDGTLAQDHGDVSGNVLFNQRGIFAVPVLPRKRTRHLRDHGHRRLAAHSPRSSPPIRGTTQYLDNGDGTITITVAACGGARLYDADGNLVLKDPGHIRFAFDIDYNGTPGDPSDDTDVPDSFRIVRGNPPGATIPRAATSVTI